MTRFTVDHQLSEERFVRVLLCGDRQMSEQEVISRMNALQITSVQLPCVVVCIASNYENYDYCRKDRVILECEQYVIQTLKKYGYIFCVSVNSRDQIQAIIKTQNTNKLEEHLIDLRKKLELRFGFELFISIGSCVDQFGLISVSANEAMQMLAYKYQYGDRGVVNIANIIRFRYNISYGSEEKFDRVISCFKDGDLGQMAVQLDELITEIRYRPNVSNSSIKRTIVELTVHMLHIASNAKVDVDEMLQDNDPYRWILQQQETPVITEWFMKLASRLIQGIREQQEAGRKQIVERSCKYIEENLSDNALGLHAVCEKNGMSPSYFSQLFKKEMKTGLNNYIAYRRVERAKELLQNTNLKNEDIALQLGFARSNYFSSVFKKITGMTPGAYRKSLRNES